MKSEKRNKPILILASLAMAVSATAGANDSSGTRGDGFTMNGNFPNSDVQIKVPQFSGAELEQKILELRKTLPDPKAKYEDYFDPRDQAAFDEVQANITARIDDVNNHMYNFKQAYVQGVVVYDHFANEAGGAGMDAKTRARQLGTVANPYHDYLMGQYDAILAALDPRSKISQKLFHMDSSGTVDVMIEGELVSGKDNYNGTTVPGSIHATRVLFGTADFSGCNLKPRYDSYRLDVNDAAPELKSCGWQVAQSRSFTEVAATCQTAPCVFEIAKIAQEMGEASLSLDNKVKFQEQNASDLHIFYDPKHSMLRRAFSNYLDREVTNHESNAIVAALEGLTNLAYIALVSPVDFLVNIRQVGTSFDFEPGHWQSKNDRNAITKYLPWEFSKIVGQILPGTIPQKN